MPPQTYSNNINNGVNVNNNNNNNNSPLYNAVATCGGNKVGNGLCSKINECCSTFGFCGVSDSHCSNRAPVAGTAAAGNALDAANGNNISGGGAAQQSSIEGTCGGGSIGNNVCSNNSECCSQYGFCGTTLQHCLGKQTAANNVDGGNNNNFGGVPVQQPQQQQQQQQQYDATTNNASGPTVITTGNIDYGGGHPEPLPIQGSSSNSNTIPHGTNKKIIGYYAGWQWYDRNKLADPVNIDFRKMQRVNYAFFQFDKQGELYGIDRWGDPQVLFGPYSSMLGGGVQKCSYDGPYDVNCGYHEHNEGLIYRAHQSGAEVVSFTCTYYGSAPCCVACRNREQISNKFCVSFFTHQYPSIGGWTLSDNFPSVSANPTAREKFAENCIKILSYYQFDGVS